MGSLTLPASGPVYLDAQILIYSVETHARYWPLLEPFWAAARDGNLDVVSSELTLMETLVGPIKNGDATLEAAYEELFQSLDMRLLPITQPVLREAARLRAAYPTLRSPDALHAATAQLHGCTLFLSNDLAFRRVPNLPLVILDDVLVS